MARYWSFKIFKKEKSLILNSGVMNYELTPMVYNNLTMDFFTCYFGVMTCRASNSTKPRL